ncbi:MAG TPA: hypothetical protein VMH01_14395 [Puia sp.]|nr:hypothetical protein [Puia sp.]
MKALLYYIVFQLAILSLQANGGHRGSAKVNEGATQLTFTKSNFNNSRRDSVLIIFDRFDRSGAGIVCKIFHPSIDNSIYIESIPSGKYFVTIQCLGIHHERFEKVIRVKSKKCESLSIRLDECDEFSKDAVFIPTEHTDFSKLKVMTMK